MSELSERIRKEFAAGDAVRDAGLTTPDNIRRYNDISYGSDSEYHLLDVYRPVEEGDKKLPVIAIVHGGAWVYGSKEVYQYYGMSLSARGFAVVNFSYRLAPEHRFPAQLEDICSVFNWIYENSDKYGFDVNNVFAVGDSAGGHLLGLYAALCSNDAYRTELKDKYPDALLNPALGLRAVALNCGKYSFAHFQDDDPNMPVILEDFLTDGGSEEELYLTDVTGHVTAEYPPVFLMTCPGDFLKNQAPLMAKSMVENSVPFEFRFYGDEAEPLHHVFHCNVRLEAGQVCNDDECDFFKERQLKVQESVWE